MPQQSLLNVGMVLREARERLGMSVNDIADRIKFAPRQVEALEANDFAHLPQATFLRGFVRSYARVLQLDEVALINALPAESVPQTVAKAQGMDVAFPTIRSLRSINVLWLAGALGVALMLVLFMSLHKGEPAASPTEVVVEPLQLPVSDVVAVSAAVPATPVQPEENPRVPPSAKAAEPVKSGQTGATVAPQTVARQTAVPSVPVATGNSPVALEILKRRPMHIVFTGDTWVEVVDVNGDLLLSRTNLSGTEKWIGGPRRAPYDVTISPPENAKLYYRGKEIDLSSYAGQKTARLKVE